MALTFAATLLPVTGPVAQTASVSDWKPGCHIDGHPIDLSFCNTGYLNGHFDGAPNHSFFEEPGAYLNIAIYDSSPQGFRLWGAAGHRVLAGVLLSLAQEVSFAPRGRRRAALGADPPSQGPPGKRY